MEEEKKKKTTNNKKKDVKKNIKKTDDKKKVVKKENTTKKDNKKKTKNNKAIKKVVVNPKEEIKEEVKIEKVKEDTKVLASQKPKEDTKVLASQKPKEELNESKRSKYLIAGLSILLFVMIVVLVYKFNDKLKEDVRYKDNISEYCEQLAKKEEKIQRENVAKEVSSSDLDKIKFNKVKCEYNEACKFSKNELKEYTAGYSYIVSIKKDGKVAYTKDVLVVKSNDKWSVIEK